MAQPTSPIVIIGGSMSGLQAALAMDATYGADLNVPIYLIDPSSYHYYTPRYWGAEKAAYCMAVPFESILAPTHIHFLQERVMHLDTDRRSIITECRQLSFEDVIIAVSPATHPHIKKQRSFQHDSNGRVMVDGSLQALDHPRVWIGGELASWQGEPRDSQTVGRHIGRAIQAIRSDSVPLAYGEKSSRALNLWGAYPDYEDLNYYRSILPLPLAWRVWQQHHRRSKANAG